MQKHKHYQAILAFADGWKIEYKKIDQYGKQDEWTYIQFPSFLNNIEYRIVPDEEGWLPWYGSDTAPIEGPVDVVFRDGTSNLNGQRWGWMHNGDPEDIIKYRPHKEEEKPAEPEYEYLFVVKPIVGQNFITSSFYKNEEEARIAFNGCKILERCEWSKRKI